MNNKENITLTEKGKIAFSKRDNLYYELRYKAYEGALNILKANNMSVQERKCAIQVRDEFERDLRNGEFLLLFYSCI